MPEALSCGDGGVSHSCCGEENTQILDGASQTFSLHLEQIAHKEKGHILYTYLRPRAGSTGEEVKALTPILLLETASNPAL